MTEKDMVQYCYNPTTKEIVEGMCPPNEQFIPIIGYFKKETDPKELQRIFEEIAARQENALDYDQYSGDPECQPKDKGSPNKE